MQVLQVSLSHHRHNKSVPMVDALLSQHMCKKRGASDQTAVEVRREELLDF